MEGKPTIFGQTLNVTVTAPSPSILLAESRGANFE